MAEVITGKLVWQKEQRRVVFPPGERVRFIAAFLRAAEGFVADDLPSHYPRASTSGRLEPVPPHPEGESFALTVDIVATIPGIDDAKAQELVEAAHQVCPYSKATRGNVDVTLSVAE